MKLRPARESEIEALEALIRASVWDLQKHCYTEAQREGALGTVFGVDVQLIRDQTYYVVELDGQLAACGGWSYRGTLFGANAGQAGVGPALDEAKDAARIRAFFVSPHFARRGLGTRILEACEQSARAKGFNKFELVATLAGEPLYAKHDFMALERYAVALPNGETLPVVRMVKP